MMKKLMKRSLVLTLALTMLLQPAALTASAEGSETAVSYNAVIMNVKGGASAIATMTFDDGVHATNSRLKPLMEEYGLKASLMAVPSRIQGIPPYSSGYSSVSELNALTEQGKYFDICSHSYSHLYMHDDGTHAANNTEQNIAKEILGSKTYIEDNFPWQDCIGFAVPGGKYSTDAMAALMQYFYSSRTGNSNASVSAMQSLDPADTADAGGWYALRNLWLKDANVNNIVAYLDHCVANGGWFVTGCHNVVLTAAELGTNNNDITVDALRTILAKMQEYQNSGKLWVATMTEATKYLREVQNSTVSQYMTEYGMCVEVKMAEKTARGQALPTDVFDMPLTVRVEIPEGWENVRFTQNGTDTVVNSFKINNKTYAYAEVAPNSGRVYITNADEDIPSVRVDATLTPAKGGATSIATMTFDDGLVGTANKLNELCAKYDAKASLMLITDRINDSNAAMWREIFAKGYLSAESHSSNHNYIVNPGHANYSAANNTPEAIYEEIAGSYADLKRYFPAQDVLTFGIPYSSYVKEAMDCLRENFYAVRGGNCAISYPSVQGKMQSLDPTFGTELGSWYNPVGVRMMPEKHESYPTITNDTLAAYLDKCVSEGGWFLSAAHGIVEGENMDITVENLSLLLAKMQHYQNQGKLWVATYSEATKYIRERQSSTVTAYERLGNIFVDLSMAENTADGLPLPADVFNMPLTVKVRVPDTYGRIEYTQAGKTYTTYCKNEGGIRYAYIDLVPNGGTASITNVGDPTEYVKNLGMKQSVDAEQSLTYNIYIPTDSKVTAVYNGIKALEGEQLDNGMTKYSVGDIQITQINTTFKFRLTFEEETGYADYEFEHSVISYFEALVESESATAKDKQIAYDFLVYARACVKRFRPGETTVSVDAIISALESIGVTATVPGATTSDLGNLTEVLNGAALTLNEKPYYVFYVNEGFTGRITFSYGDPASPTSTTFEVINGYYHCKHYVIYEVENVYDLAEDIRITVEEKSGATYNAVAEGSYSLGAFVEGVSGDNGAPEYATALYAYVLSAREYNNK